jgi:hypothetical protein
MLLLISIQGRFLILTFCRKAKLLVLGLNIAKRANLSGLQNEHAGLGTANALSS